MLKRPVRKGSPWQGVMWGAGVLGMGISVSPAFAATVYEDPTSYKTALSAVGVTTQSLISFEDLPSGTVLDDDYAGLGVRFSAPYSITLSPTVHGSAARGTLAAQAGTGNDPASFTLLFDQAQKGISLYLMDVSYALTVQAYDAGGLKETFTVNALGEDTAGGRFRGMIFVSAMTRVVITTQLGDGIGLDDLSFTSLDTDGDGYGPGTSRPGGDCNDKDATTYPGAPELIDGKDQDCDGIVDNAYTIFTDVGLFDDSAVDANIDFLTTLDFEDVTTGYDLAEAYRGLGVLFTGASAITASTDVSGSKPNGKLGANVASTNLANFIWVFDEPQTHLSCRFLDMGVAVTITAYDDGGLVNQFNLSALAEDTPSGLFRGLSFHLPITRLVVTSTSTSDGIGFDDVQFVSLDLDGDGYGPGTGRRGGDCDDSDPTSYPGGIELSGDGIDQNCDGLIDNAVTVYTSPTLFQTDGTAQGVPAFKKIDFETLALATVINTQYKSLGVTLLPSTGVTAEKDVYSSLPRGVRAAKVTSTTPGTFTWQFDEVQRFVGAYFLDISGPITVQAYSGTSLINSFSFTAPGEDLPGGVFRGFSFSQAINKLVFTGVSGDGIGYDDLLFDPVDDDLDGYTSATGDCNDSNASVNPGATEVCNGVDDDCDASTDEGFDKDSDGWVSCAVSTRPADCNDNNANVAPGLEESCDRIDNDCDAVIDEGFDVDQDGVSSCASPTPDCNDTNAAVKPGASEVCNGVDDDCDGTKDEGFDKDSDTFYTCALEGNPADCNDNAGNINPNATEIPYNGVDEDCSGADLTDVDNDGFAGGTSGPDCDDTDPSQYPGAIEIPYNDIDEDCSGADLIDVDGDGVAGPSTTGLDCDDNNNQTYPGASEIDDDEDNDCDGQIDEALDTTDDDLDGFSEASGDCNDNDSSVKPGGVEVPYNGQDDDCLDGDLVDVDLDGYNGGTNGPDCNDDDNTINPAATEIPYNNVDEDCSGGALTDVDGDGYDGGSKGTDCNDADAAIHPDATETPYDTIDQDCIGGDLVDVDADGYRAVQVGGDDCQDDNAAIHPAAPEAEDGIDNNCDGRIDETTDAFDDDGDGYSEVDGDCNDADLDIFPGSIEIPYDGIDDDCSGDDLTDVDEDGFAGGTDGDDCDDTASAIHPGVEEICGDEVDENCDGEAEACPVTPTPGEETPTATPSDVTPTATPGEETPTATPSEATPTSTPTDVTPTPTDVTPTPEDGSPTPDGTDVGGGCSCDTGASSQPSYGALLLVGLLGLRMVRRKRVGG